MSVLDDIADRLTTQGIATTGTNLFKGFMPKGPDEVLGLFMTGGPPPVHGMGSGPGGAAAERPHLQVLCRSDRPDSALFLIRKATQNLDKLGPQTINGVVYRSVFALQDPFYVYQDESGRFIFSVNFEIVRDAATSS